MARSRGRRASRQYAASRDQIKRGSEWSKLTERGGRSELARYPAQAISSHEPSLGEIQAATSPTGISYAGPWVETEGPLQKHWSNVQESCGACGVSLVGSESA